MKRAFMILVILVVLFLGSIDAGAFKNIAWERISAEIREVNAVWIDKHNPEIILIGTKKGIFRTEDGGDSWNAVFVGLNKEVNSLYADPADGNLIYACCVSGLFLSRNQGKRWARIYKGIDDEKSNCLSVAKINKNELFLGTAAGLFNSKNNGRNWKIYPGRLSEDAITTIASDQENQFIFVAACDGLYRIKSKERAEKVFFFQELESEEEDEEIESKINHIALDPSSPEDIYLATTRGIFISRDWGSTWQRLSDRGLLNRNISFITASRAPSPKLLQSAPILAPLFMLLRLLLHPV